MFCHHYHLHDVRSICFTHPTHTHSYRISVLSLLSRHHPQKLFLWATLVFFKRGTQLQMGAATLLNVIRLVIHAHFEPYIDPNDNLFEYLTLIITSLTGLGGLLLQGLETSKDYAMSKSDEVGKRAAEEQIKGVMLFLDVGVYCIIVIFALFFANIMVGHNETVRTVCRKLRHQCARQKDTEGDDGARPVCREGNTKTLGWLQRSTLRCRTRKGGNGSGGEVKGGAATAGESSMEMIMMGNPSFQDASSRGGEEGGAGGGREGKTAAGLGGVRPAPRIHISEGNSSHGVSPFTVSATKRSSAKATLESSAVSGAAKGGYSEEKEFSRGDGVRGADAAEGKGSAESAPHAATRVDPEGRGIDDDSKGIDTSSTGRCTGTGGIQSKRKKKNEQAMGSKAAQKEEVSLSSMDPEVQNAAGEMELVVHGREQKRKHMLIHYKNAGSGRGGSSRGWGNGRGRGSGRKRGGGGESGRQFEGKKTETEVVRSKRASIEL